MAKFVNIHTHCQQNLTNIELVTAKLFDNLNQYSKCSIGIHPWEIGHINIEDNILWLKENIAKDINPTAIKRELSSIFYAFVLKIFHNPIRPLLKHYHMVLNIVT